MKSREGKCGGVAYWTWTESRWKAPNVEWTQGKIVTAGVDVGSVSTQAAVMVDGMLYSYSSIRTGPDSQGSSLRALDWALHETGLRMEDIHYIVATGYGRVNVPFAKKTITEIACHALGAHFIYGPTVRTILDMGGQDCKAIRCDAKGRVVSFIMNDRCAAGTGRGMEVFAEMMGIPLEEIGDFSLKVDNEPPPVSSTCVVFARSEASSLLRRGWSKEMVVASYCAAMAKRVALLLERLGVEREFAITGGIAKNRGVVVRLERELGVKALSPKMDTQVAGAIGAALFAHALARGAGA